MHGPFISNCLSCSFCFFATNSSQFFNFLAISCMTFLEESNPPFQFSTQAYFISLSLICPSPHWSHAEQHQKSSFPNIQRPLLLQLHTLGGEPFSPRTANSAFRSRISWRCSFGSRSLFPLDSDLQRVETTVSLSRSAQVSLMLLWLFTDSSSANSFQRLFPMTLVSTRWELCLLLLYACGCLKFPIVEVHRARWWRVWWRRNRAGNSCGCRGGWHRRRTWAHDLCLESDWSNSQTFHAMEQKRTRTSGSSQRCGRGWGSWQRTSEWRSNRVKTTDKDTQQRHDTEMRWLLRIHIE